MRDWLTIIIVLLILGILLDGVRRMRAYRKHSLKISKDYSDDPLADEASVSEFPSGGARVVAYREPADIGTITENARKKYTDSRRTKGSRNKLPEKVALNLDVPAPVLMDIPGSEPDKSHCEPEADAIDDLNVSIDDLNSIEVHDSGPSLGSLDGLDEMAPDLTEASLPNYTSGTIAGDIDCGVVDGADASLESDSSQLVRPEERPELAPQKSQIDTVEACIEEPESEPEAEANLAPDLVLVINVMARRGQVFTGSTILNAFVQNGLRYGDMDIFHRHESADGKGKVLFSLANIVMPGTFDLSEMNYFESPGFSMFLSLPISGDSLGVYELMADTAQAIALELGGELKDENRSVMTRQTIEHDRQRVIEYERQKRLERA